MQKRDREARQGVEGWVVNKPIKFFVSKSLKKKDLSHA